MSKLTNSLLMVLVYFCITFIVFAKSTIAQEPDDIVVYTAREIITLDEDRPLVEAIAVQGDRIIATGTLNEVRQFLAGRSLTISSRFNDLVIIPGLINQHEHAWLASLLFIANILSIEDWVLPDKTISRAADASEYRQRLRTLVRQHADSNQVFYTWGYHQLFHGELSRADLDAISNTIPIVVLQRSIHEQIHNTAALEFFGIDQSLIDSAPESVRDQTNLAEGHFWEQGQSLIVPRVFANLFHPERYLPALEQLEKYWHAAGTTLVAEPGGIVSPALITAQNQVLGDENTPFRMYYIADGRSFINYDSTREVITETEKISAGKSIEFWEKKSMAIARGNAIAVQDDKTLRADILTALFKKMPNGRNEIVRVDAYDNVSIKSPKEVIRGKRGIYNTKTGIVILHGGVKITRGPDQLNGDSAEVNLNTGVSRLLSTGKNKVRGLFGPKNFRPEKN